LTPIELARKGWHLIPWSKRASSSRQPMVKGYLGTLPTPEEVADWHRKWPSCDWAIKPTFHVVLDIEMKNGLDGEAELIEKFQPLEGFPSTKTFNGGRHVWMRVPHDCTLKGGVWIGDALEVKFKASVHIPPSEGYAWLSPLGSLTDVPLAPDWFMEAWAKAAPVSIKATETASFPEGQRHALLCSAAGALRNLGLGEEGIFLGLQGVRADRCENPETVTDDELRGIAKSYCAKEASESFDMRLARGEERAVMVANFMARKIVHRDEPDRHADESCPRLNDKQLRPTPMIAAWVDWVLGNAECRQPELTLLAACVGIGCVMGRRPTWKFTHANVYGLGMASSGSGKDAPLHSIEEVLRAAGWDDLIGAANLGSDVGMLDQITQHPDIVWSIDEIGILLENLNKTQVPTYISNIISYLLQLSSCKAFNGRALKGVTPQRIEQPYPCIFACTQPKIFLGAFNERMADNGFFNRFTVFLGEDLPEQQIDVLRAAPPEDLIEALKSAREKATNPLMNGSHGGKPGPAEIAATPEALALYRNKIIHYNSIKMALRSKDVMRATLAARTLERANKFTLIYAWTLDPSNPVVTPEAVEWGCEIAEFSNACLLHCLKNRIASPHDELARKILTIIESYEQTGVSQSDFTRHAQSIERNKRESIIADLQQSGKVYVFTKKNESGRVVKRYKSAKFTTQEERT